MKNNGSDKFSISAYDRLSSAVKATNTQRPIFSRILPSLSQNDLWSIGTNSNSQIAGAYKLLLVDDDKIVRKLLRRRFSKIFPHAIIDEADCGEKAIECTCTKSAPTAEAQKELSTTYDIIFIDHIMGEGLTGDQTIKKLRDNDIDSLIVGISGNSEEVSHISAGAEDFFQKPLPSQGAVIQRLVMKLPPPSGWRVLILDDVKVGWFSEMSS